MRLLHALILALCLTLCAPARAADNARLQPILCNPVGDIISSAVFDAGAACGNSYPGRGMVFNNLQRYNSPAETAVESSCPLTESGIDFTVLASDPTFVGHPGKRGSYWSFNGAQFFAVQNFTDPFADGWGKYPNFNKPFAFVIAMHYVDNGAIQALFSTELGTKVYGVTGYIDTDRKVKLEQDGDLAQQVISVNTTALTSGHDYIIGIAHSGTTAQAWVASTTAQSGTSVFKNAAFEPAGRLTIGALAGGSSGFFANGTKVYDIQTFTSLSDADFAADVTFLHARDGIGFSP